MVLVASSGCAVKWTPYYDQTLDSKATSFQQDLESYLTKLENLQAPACTYQQNLDFYEKASAELAVMQTRAQASQHNAQLLEITASLNKNFADLKTLQQGAGSGCLNSVVIEAARSRVSADLRIAACLRAGTQGQRSARYRTYKTLAKR